MSTPAEKYVTYWHGPTFPQWVTRLENGQYQSYHYIREAADRNTAHLNELVKLRSENAALRKGLDDAATSLRTISQQAGRTEELSEMSQIRGYAFSRYSAAIDAISAKEGGAT